MEKSTGEVFPQARVGPNGELMFPHRGTPPKAIQGYIKDSGDPFIFKPLVSPCKYRSIMWKKICGGQVQTMHCSKFGICVKTIDCLSCEESNGNTD